MIKICLRQFRVLSLTSLPIFRFSKKFDESTSLVKKVEDVDKMVEYWDHKLSQVRPDSITVKQALNKIYLAETLMGTELQEKNVQFYEEVFDKNFIERVYIPKEFPQKIQIIFNIAMELSLLEYQYRLNRREFQKLEQALVRIKSILDNIYQYEKKKSDLGEAEFNHFLRQSQYFDMKAFYQKALNPEGYVQFIEESTKCLDSAVKIVNDIIKHKNDEEQLRFQMGKSQTLDKIARNFQLLAEFFLIAGQDDDARMFLEKAIEIYDTLYNGITPKSLICKCRIARSYMKDDQQKANKMITELYDQIAQFGESDYLLLVKMYKFTITSQQQVDETEYEEVFELMQKYEVSDPFVISEVFYIFNQLLFVSIKYTYKQNYHRALEKHLIQALMILETTNDKKINLEQLLHLVGNVSIELPQKFNGQMQILKRVYENFEKWKNLIEDEYFWDHLTLLSLIKAKLYQLDGKPTETILQPIISFLNEAKENDKQFLMHQNQISRFLKKNGLLQEQNKIEDLTSNIKKLV